MAIVDTSPADGQWLIWSNDFLGLAADPVAIPVEVLRVGTLDVPEHAEVAVRDVRALQVRRRKRDADVRIGGGAVSRRRRRRRRDGSAARRAEGHDRVELDAVRGGSLLAAGSVEEADAR